jgi:serine/threonine-protein kinase
LLGLALGRYIVREKLAEGGMGAVYVAHHERLPDTKRVVKVLLHEYANHPVIRARFEREATAAARLKHRYIIKIDDFGALPDGQLYLMMPFLDGKSLEAHISQRVKLNVYDTLHIVAQVLVGLQHLHDAGIVHRDLKPGNIFITREDDNPYKVTLLDLGIARDVAEEATTLKTDTGISMGTPGYMAPEQYGTASTATPAADLYAVGIVAWEMLTGQRPWIAPSPTMLYHLQITEPPRLPNGVELPPELLAWLHRMLAKEPADRPQSARVAAVSFASLVPAIPPHVPSGAEILAKVAREFVIQATPIEETVRNQGDVGRSPGAAMLWTPQGTHVPPIASGTPPDRFSAPRHTPPSAPAVVATANQRPHGPVAAAASPTPALPLPVGMQAPKPASAKTSTSRIVALGLVGALAAGVGTFLIASNRRHHASTPTASASDAAIIAPSTAARAGSAAADAPAPPTAKTAPIPVAASVDASVPAPVDAAIPPSRSHVHSSPSNPPIRRSGNAPATNGSASTPSTTKRFDPDAVED